MPFKPYSDLKYTTLPHSVAIFNAIRAEASETYKTRVPEATQQNISDVANPLFTYSAVFNEWYSALVNRIAFTVISSKMYNNPLGLFKRGLIEVGETIEEIFIDLIKAEPYYLVNDEDKTACQDLYERRLAQVKSAFHTRNRQDKYPLSISYDDMRSAFTSWEGVDNFIRRKIEQLFASDQYDEYILMKHVFFEAGTRGALAEVVIPDGADKATMQEVLIAMREMVLNVSFRSNKYNYAQVSTFSNREDLVLFALPNFISRVDVVALAEAFNLEKTDFLSRVVIVDDFGGLETAGVKAILADKDWFMVYDNLFTMREAENGARLYNNMFLHHWQTISYSPFKTAIAFTTQPSEVLSVTINPSDLTLTRNNTDNPTATLLQAEVSGTGMYNPDVVWSTTIGHISDSGLLEVPNTWDGSEGVVTAISKQDGTVLDTITVRLIPNSQVTDLTIHEHDGTDIPSTLTVERTVDNTEVILTAMLEGTAIRDKSVIWTTTAGEITQDGILKLNPYIDETDIRVTAYSRQDPSILHEITVSYLPERGVYSSLTPIDKQIRITLDTDAMIKCDNINVGSLGINTSTHALSHLIRLVKNDGSHPIFLGCSPNDIVFTSFNTEVDGDRIYIPYSSVRENVKIDAYLCVNKTFSKIATFNEPYNLITPTPFSARGINHSLYIVISNVGGTLISNADMDVKTVLPCREIRTVSNQIMLVDIRATIGKYTIEGVAKNVHAYFSFTIDLDNNIIKDNINTGTQITIVNSPTAAPDPVVNIHNSDGNTTVTTPISGGATVNPWQPGGGDDVIIQGDKPPTGGGSGNGDGNGDGNGSTGTPDGGNPPTDGDVDTDNQIEWGFDFDNNTYHDVTGCPNYNKNTFDNVGLTQEEEIFLNSMNNVYSSTEDAIFANPVYDDANKVLEFEVVEKASNITYLCRKWIDQGLLKRKGNKIRAYMGNDPLMMVKMVATEKADMSKNKIVSVKAKGGVLAMYDGKKKGWVTMGRYETFDDYSQSIDDIPFIN